MKRYALYLALVVCVPGLLIHNADAARSASGMKEGKVEFKSVGPLAFGPDGILFVADTKAAAIIAIATGDVKSGGGSGAFRVEGVNEKISALLGTAPDQILIEDLAINPLSQNAYLSVSRGRGPDAIPVLVRVKTDGKMDVISTDKVKFSRADLPDPPVDGLIGQGNRQSNPRRESITDLEYFDGRVLVAGLANEEFASTLRAVPFPFQTVENGAQVEIYHGAHGRFETRSPVRTFTQFRIGGQPHLLAAYTCTPLVQFPISQLKPGAKIQGKTIAELGNRNRPLDMIVYEKDGKPWVLMANNSRGVMKIDLGRISQAESITQPVPDGGVKGLAFETIAGWTGVEQLDRFDDKHVAVVRRSQSGSLNLEALPLP
ncbi:MAG: hypothetical protein KIT57_22035 [Blastocatellales bacterium]|nr:hypothetical protein [Blastocatellales bacterium]